MTKRSLDFIASYIKATQFAAGNTVEDCGGRELSMAYDTFFGQ